MNYLSSEHKSVNYQKCQKTTWDNMIQTCIENKIDLAEVVLHTKYPINSEKIFEFIDSSEIMNTETGLILYDYLEEKHVKFPADKYIFNEDEWNFILPELNKYDLLYKELTLLYKESDIQDEIITIKADDKLTYFYSRYYVKFIFKVKNNSYEIPSSLKDLFIDNGSCINAIYVREV